MNIEYKHTFPFSQDIVWMLIQDERILRNSIPGCQSFIKGDGDLYLVEMGLSVGPVKGAFTGEVQQVDQVAPSSYRLLLKGKGKPGEIDAIANMKLEEVENGTQVVCTADVRVTGMLASIGQRIMNGFAKLILGQFFKSVEKEMSELEAHS
ncbi:CoxG family protein [Ammoniphilus sp. CFH 90114]|uniref:CoxG family protein n=1 Tax=Ammoniphilus sp. CFH 90114 TaxID=2493665 RepID=UPI00100DA5AE|nr:carbon monoxide dehydrogenase subunit G [Ammoniphilus sp. CFH 90114]RXT06416.1 carbon monoxide dehydrogenase [Ammoniphilus sp. CFH 90114]